MCNSANSVRWFLRPSAVLLAGCLTWAAASSALAEPSGQQTNPQYGTPATPEQIAGWDIDVRPDGTGLPEGKGSVEDGAETFQTHCASCHGTFGEGMGRYPKLAGGMGSLTDDRPEKTVGSYWPYASTLWDYIHRAMPFYAPQSLTDDQVYEVVAYVLNLNNIVDSDFVADQDTLAKVQMPNRNGFYYPDPRPDTPRHACMHDCNDGSEAKITSTADGKNLTPATTGPLDEGQTQ